MNKDLFELLLSEGEGFTLEYKQGISRDLASEMVAFANSRGGKILFGVKDDGTVIGVKNKNKLKSQIQNIARNCEPHIVIHFSERDDVIVGTIPEGKNKPYKCKAGFYTRMGPNSQRLTRDEVISFIQNEGHIRWDEQPYTTFPSAEVYSKNLFQAYARKAGLSTHLPDEHTLANLRCALLIDGFQLTNAGYLFFGILPEDAMTYTGITCALYKGTSKCNVIDRKDYQEDVQSNIENAMLFLKRVINVRYELPYGELRRKSIPEIPYEALREAVINAVTHRDYTNKGPCTMIEVFDDRIEISNPGGLPASLNPEQFGFKSVPRNQVIAEMMLRIAYIEKMGTGISKMRNLCSEARIPEPEFDFSGFFTVTFRRSIPSDSEKGSEENLREGSEESSEKGSEENLGEGSEENLGKGSEENLGEGSEENLGEGSEENLGEGSEENLGKGSEENLGEGSEKSPEKGSEENLGEGSEESPEKGSEENLGEGSEENLGEGSEENLGKGSEESLEKGSEENLGEGSEENLGEGSEKSPEKGSEKNLGEGSEESSGEGSEKNLREGSEESSEKGSEENLGEGSEENLGEGSEESPEKGSEENLGEGSEENMEKSSEKILELLRINPLLTAREIADEIGLSDRAVEKQIANLKNHGYLKRIGSKKGGYWRVGRKL